jgi:putative FmdB family regulatory protein
VPIYEYRCQKCGHKFEKLVRGATNPEGLKCRKCEDQSVERLMSCFGIGGSTSSAVSSAGGCAPAGGG